MKSTIILNKMITHYAKPVDYQLQGLNFKEYMGQRITIRYLNKINCIQCGRVTQQSFQQGYCYSCMLRLQECNMCLLHPERCLVEKGTCPENDWAHAQCHSPQIVYLANSSGLKVGITRDKNIPMRWIDQGAIQALPIMSASNRYQCGLIEVALKQFVADKTNWRAMLKNEVCLLDLRHERDILLEQAAAQIAEIMQRYPQQIKILDEKPVEIFYPVATYPQKITSLSLDKTPEVSGILQGLKGQYLILDSGVINIRKFGGYNVEVVV